MNADPQTIRIPWRSQLRHEKDAPRDGSIFYGIAKGQTEPDEWVWDEQMNCFLSISFATANNLASWWPISTPASPLNKTARH